MSTSQITELKADIKRYRSKLTKAKNELDDLVKSSKKPHCRALPNHHCTYECLEGDEHIKAVGFVSKIYSWEDLEKTLIAKLAELANSEGGEK